MHCRMETQETLGRRGRTGEGQRHHCEIRNEEKKRNAKGGLCVEISVTEKPCTMEKPQESLTHQE